MTVDLLAQVRAEIDARMADLRPAVQEYERLLGAADALAADADVHDAGVDAGAARERAPKHASGRAPKNAGGPVRASADDAASDPGSSNDAVTDLASSNDAATDPASGDDAATDPASGDAAIDRATPARRRGPRGSAAGAIARARSAPRRATEQAIVAALEHGSHTVGELVLVTALSAAEIRAGVRSLQRARTVTPTKRDGRAAYALSSAAAD